MGISFYQLQQETIISKIKDITGGEWMILVIDDSAKEIIDNCVQEDDILNNNVANIERLEDKRGQNSGMEAIYMLSPKPHIVDTLIADLEKQRYQGAHLLWTDALPRNLQERILKSSRGRNQIRYEEELSIDFFSRESHIATFRDPWSFPILYNLSCSDLVQEHMKGLAQKITNVCVSLGEYPKVRFYEPQNALHDARVLCFHLARFVQQALDGHARRHQEYPPPSNRPQSVLLITDRSMDLMAPLVHEFTYQAMAHDVLPVKEGKKVTYHVSINQGEEEEDMELQEKDETWVENRHRHMKDTIDTLMTKFQKFVAETPGGNDGSPANLNMIKDMLASMPKFQELKAAYTLHLAMAEDCMNTFQAHKLPELQSVEQSLATGYDEDFRKPKNMLQEVVRLCDDEGVTPEDRLRLITVWLIYRHGVVEEDVKRLLAHAGLPQDKLAALSNMENLGARVFGQLKEEKKPLPPPLFPMDTTQVLDEEYGLIRYHTNVKHMLESLCRGDLSAEAFPYTIPPESAMDDPAAVQNSLRAAKPSWANRGAGAARRQDNRQRIMVFMAGGATFSESRACYEVTQKYSREVFLITSHMVTPKLFLRQVGDLSIDRRRLDLPADRPKPRPAAWVFEPERPTPPPMNMYSQAGPSGPAPPPKNGPGSGMPGGRPVGLPGRPGQSMAPPTQAMGAMSMEQPRPPPMPMNGGGSASTHSPSPSSESNKLEKDKKKKRNMFGFKK